MRTQRIALSLALSIGGLIIQGPASAQEYRGTAEQQMACTPDVWRLCGHQIPNVNGIVACLQQNTPQLSPGCRAVFQSDVVAPVRGPNGRMVRARPYAVPAPPPYAMRPGPPPPYYDDEEY
ncbi:MAG: hypothetical protein HY852_19940 [Bradyrhizobium sp.]|uniref:hypothetical protein n=1 Tax=Bradyrhizobium sp. TaxID=376 RepID=UPI0025BA16B6|nr:hypothetical protein [Bradyrhizobium sp.]MBI5264078.1 hypothetical protein [Bradyrhizobium sp.]